ncbi:hypothetical protein BCR34DRAFT_584445 [Clohesyomyces aquaticus]|uniref:Uncharacterized protein n=1 Tax=Clohesyomyces aquaticus TaxID=1231657 RepID=A0A1Y2A196_9PLEO|nr:hypothetical protein BCR34DRAFT_584445 [Clohesyomyces aquaticus]
MAYTYPSSSAEAHEGLEDQVKPILRYWLEEVEKLEEPFGAQSPDWVDKEFARKPSDITPPHHSSPARSETPRLLTSAIRTASTGDDVYDYPTGYPFGGVFGNSHTPIKKYSSFSILEKLSRPGPNPPASTKATPLPITPSTLTTSFTLLPPGYPLLDFGTNIIPDDTGLMVGRSRHEKQRTVYLGPKKWGSAKLNLDGIAKYSMDSSDSGGFRNSAHADGITDMIDCVRPKVHAPALPSFSQAFKTYIKPYLRRNEEGSHSNSFKGPCQGARTSAIADEGSVRDSMGAYTPMLYSAAHTWGWKVWYRLGKPLLRLLQPRIVRLVALFAMLSPVVAVEPGITAPGPTSTGSTSNFSILFLGVYLGMVMGVPRGIGRAFKSLLSYIFMMAVDLSAPVMAASSVLFVMFRNDDSVLPQVAWSMFGIWSIATLAYLKEQANRLVHVNLYILISAVLAGLCMCIVALAQKASLKGGIVTAIPISIAFSLHASAFAFQKRQPTSNLSPV